MIGLLTFILVLGLLWWCMSLDILFCQEIGGILVREFAIGMGPKIFPISVRIMTTYTIRSFL